MTDTTNDRGALATALAGDDPTNGVTQPTSGTPTPAPAGEKHWYSDLPAELQGSLEKKGWNSPTALPNVVKSYFELEKSFSASDKLLLPKDDTDPKAWDPVWNRLGRPESPDKYTFPEGVDPNLAKGFAEEAHRNGYTQKQVEFAAKWQMQQQQAIQESERQRVVADQNAAEVALKQEWGNKFNENIEYARRAMRGLGMNLDQHFIPMAAAVGSKNALKLLQLAGLNTREDNAAAIGDQAAGFGLTPNRAKAELSEKGAELLRRAREGDATAKAHWQRLQKAIAGDGFIEM